MQGQFTHKEVTYLVSSPCLGKLLLVINKPGQTLGAREAAGNLNGHWRNCLCIRNLQSVATSKILFFCPIQPALYWGLTPGICQTQFPSSLWRINVQVSTTVGIAFFFKATVVTLLYLGKIAKITHFCR